MQMKRIAIIYFFSMDYCFTHTHTQPHTSACQILQVIVRNAARRCSEES